jgi:hypothetical protein
MRTVIVSDLHLGSGISADLLGRPRFREPLLAELEGADRVVLLGDVIEFRDRPLAEALEISAGFFADLAEAVTDAEVILVPGNHDHYVIQGWLERRRLDEIGPLELEHRTEPEGAIAKLLGPLGEVAIAYPGVWLREDVYATHGHYLDRHLTIPTFERLGVAAVERILGPPPTGPDPLAPPDELPPQITPDEYERVQAPVYALLFALAQGVVPGRVGPASPSARLWAAFGGGDTRVARLRGWLLGSVALPGAVGVANRLGLGPVRSDLSPGALTRAGLAAVAETIRRLGIEAPHFVFGHTHRRGPLLGEEEGWEVDGVTGLWNTGSWVYSPTLLGSTAATSPYWPGTVGVIDDEGPPELRHLLDSVSREELGAE